MSYLWTLELTITRINLSLCSIFFPNLFSSIRPIDSIYDLFFNSSLTIANVSSCFYTFIPKILSFKALLLHSWSNSMNFFISSLIGLIFNFCSKLFRAKLLINFSSSSLISSLRLLFYSTSSSFLDCFCSWLFFSISCNLASIFCS
jgi:hypothetical protein